MSGFDRLNAADPGHEPDEVTLARLRKRVLRGDTRRFNPMRIAAGVTAFALIAGGGVAVGRMTAPSSTNTVAEAAMTGGPNTASSLAPADRLSTKATDASRSYMWWGGRTVLNPAASMSDEGGVAPGFTFTSIEGVDKRAVLRGIASLIGASGEITVMGRGDDSMIIGSNDGTKPMAGIYQDPMLSFYGYNNELSPWNCVKQSDIDSSTKPEAYPPGTRVCTDEDLKPASRADADKAFAQLLEVLGLRTSDVTKSFVDTGNQQVVMIQGNAKVNGTETNLQRIAVSVSAKGVFNVSGFAAKAVQVDGYQIVGAKTAALRSQLSKWSALGPNPFGEWGVYPMDGQVGSPRILTVEGRPGIYSNVDFFDVSKARLGLVTYYNESGTLLLPSWIYTAADGREWSMIAVAEKYVKFGN